MRRAFVLCVLMIASGLAANRTLAAFQTHIGAGSLVDSTSPQVTLPGAIYVSQDGGIYAIAGSAVRRLELPSGGAWIQPRVLSDGSLLVVRRFAAYSDLYRVAASGQVLRRLTNNNQSSDNRTLQLNHWILWPALGSDGSTVYFAADSPKPAPGQGYEVDFSLWSAPVDGQMTIGDNGIDGATRWSVPDLYTGGDVEPVPLPDGDLLYSSDANSGKGTVLSVLGVQSIAGGAMTALTTVDQDCRAPAVAADGVTIAMVCTDNRQTANLEIATFEGTRLGPPRVLVANCLCNSPSWSPHGDDLLYMNAADPNGSFGLWYIAHAASGRPGVAQRVTDASVDLDATSAAAWVGDR